MASDLLEAFEIRPLSLPGTPSRFSSVWSGMRLQRFEEAGSSHEASPGLPLFPDLAGHFRRPCLFHFLPRDRAHSFPCRSRHLFVLGGRNPCGCASSWPVQFSGNRLVDKLRIGVMTQVWGYLRPLGVLWLVGSQTERAPDIRQNSWSGQVGLAFEWLVACYLSLDREVAASSFGSLGLTSRTLSLAART